MNFDSSTRLRLISEFCFIRSFGTTFEFRFNYLSGSILNYNSSDRSVSIWNIDSHARLPTTLDTAPFHQRWLEVWCNHSDRHSHTTLVAPPLLELDRHSSRVLSESDTPRSMSLFCVGYPSTFEGDTVQSLFWSLFPNGGSPHGLYWIACIHNWCWEPLHVEGCAQ